MEVHIERTRLASKQYAVKTSSHYKRSASPKPFVRNGFGRVSTSSGKQHQHQERYNLVEECVVPSPTLQRKKPAASGRSNGHRSGSGRSAPGRRSSFTQTDEPWRVMLKAARATHCSRAVGGDGDGKESIDFHKAR